MEALYAQSDASQNSLVQRLRQEAHERAGLRQEECANLFYRLIAFKSFYVHPPRSQLRGATVLVFRIVKTPHESIMKGKAYENFYKQQSVGHRGICDAD